MSFSSDPIPRVVRSIDLGWDVDLQWARFPGCGHADSPGGARVRGFRGFQVRAGGPGGQRSAGSAHSRARISASNP